ncbi:hypothetical protein Rhopal_002648-T1 [Rhodotorula paludigena]|uniref:Uncharacterized protein n=1 Tax=Rhodotorula paludigena TaxID=86838 RepID=A0AAV5GB49_9BASI|nr:hypothetical protein Rhopal_002648-T1 [Rhodotorula paludigena]
MPVVTRARSNALSSAASSPYPASAPPRPQRKPVKKSKKVEIKTATSPVPPTARLSRKRSLDDDILASTGRIDDEEVDAGRPLKRSKTAPAPTSVSTPRKAPSAPKATSAAAPSPALLSRKRTASSREQEDDRPVSPLAPPAYSHKRCRRTDHQCLEQSTDASARSVSPSSSASSQKKEVKTPKAAAALTPVEVLILDDDGNSDEESTADVAERGPDDLLLGAINAPHRSFQEELSSVAPPLPVNSAPWLNSTLSRFPFGGTLQSFMRGATGSNPTSERTTSAESPEESFARLYAEYHRRIREQQSDTIALKGRGSIVLKRNIGSDELHLVATLKTSDSRTKLNRPVNFTSRAPTSSTSKTLADLSGPGFVEVGRAGVNNVTVGMLQDLIDQAADLLNGGASFETVKTKLVRLAHARDQQRFGASDDGSAASTSSPSSNAAALTDGSL